MTRAHRPQTVAEQRLAHALPPPQDTPLRGCHHCGAAYLDCPDGREAHTVVFGHQPTATPAATDGPTTTEPTP